MAASLLVIDVGNTSTSIAIYKNGRVSKIRKNKSLMSSGAAAKRFLDEAYPSLKPSAVVISSVVPKVNKFWNLACKNRWHLKPIFISHTSKLPMPITFPKPEQIGADRLVNAAAVTSLYGAPAVVIDIGTACTFDIVHPKKGYVGGIIAPGLPLMFSYMAEKTALLPKIEPAKLKGSIGKSTEEAMRIGAQIGYKGMIREMLDSVKKELRVKEIQVIGTGGYAKWVLPEMNKKIPLEPDLTLKGLGIVYEFATSSES